MSEVAVGGLGRRWVVANIVGFGAGAGIFGASQQVWLRPYFEVVTDAGEAARIQGLSSAVGLAFFGGSVGLAEWLVLRTRLRVVWWARPQLEDSGLAARWRAPSAGRSAGR